MKKLIACIIIIGSLSSQAQVKNILFIGNSYTYVNDLPSMIQNIALSYGDTLIKDQSTAGGSSLNAHTSNPTTTSKIMQGGWDYVIIQAQSQEPSFPPAQVATQTYPYAKILVDSTRTYSTCVEPIFYMTWGRKNGDASNCASYPPICTYAGMQQRLKDSYLEMADSNKAAVAPVGMAWNNVRNNFPSIELYQPDESHPSLHGSYLAACVFYVTLFQKSCIGSTFMPVGIGTGDAVTLQTVATNTVLDSLPLWQINANKPIANFNYSGGSSINFTNTSTNGNTYYWNFDDGNTSTLENPTNVYSNNGSYNVQLIVFSKDSCFSDTITQNLNINNVGLNEIENGEQPIIYPNPTHNFIQLNSNYNSIEIIDITGKVIKIINQNSKIDVSMLTNGIYFIKAIREDIIFTHKFIKQ